MFARLAPKQDLTDLEPVLFTPGPHPKEVFEFTGDEGTAKTQMLLHLIVKCILPKTWRGCNLKGLQTDVVFIDLDFHFSILRLTAMLEGQITVELSNEKDCCVTEGDIEELIKQCLNRLFYIRCASYSQFLVTLHSLESLLSGKPDISVLMIDSISAFYWTEKLSAGDSYKLQDANQAKMVKILQKTLSTYNLVLFVTKPVFFYKKGTDVDSGFGPTSASGVDSPFRRADSESCGEPSEHMSKTWAQFVTNKYLFTKHETLQTGNNGTDPVYVQQFKITWNNPESGSQTRIFSVSDKGVSFK